jgi:hypothetical protein
MMKTASGSSGEVPGCMSKDMFYLPQGRGDAEFIFDKPSTGSKQNLSEIQKP